MDRAPLTQLQEKIAATWQLLKLDEKRQEVLALEAQVNDPAFWKNAENARVVSQKLNDLKKEIETWEMLRQEVNDTAELAKMAANENDASLQKDIEKKITELCDRYSTLEFFVLLSGEYDASDAIVSMHAGAGGTDSQDWAQMLLRMITRFCEQRGWQVDVLDISHGTEAGIKSVMLNVKGRYAYGYLQSENGVHRLVRQSPFNADGLRQTSFAMIEVIPDLGALDDVKIDDKDIRIDVYRAGGHGGQGVNTTDSAVRIVHIPTGIVVTCQNERSQLQNKATAMHILKSKLHKQYLDEQEAEKRKLRGTRTSAEWGNQIRSYVLHPYKMVKDHRTNYEVSNPDKVLDGDLSGFIEAYLHWKQG